jgi:hypothetical protein
MCGNDTGQLATSSQQIMDSVDRCTPQPAAKVLSTVEALDFNQIITSPCCAELCLHKFDVSQIQACHIQYLSMTQAASHQWLRTLMENQPLHHQLYHLHHQVLSILQLIGDSFLTTPVACLQAGVHACLWNL